MSRLVFLVPLLLVGACSWIGNGIGGVFEQPEPTLADLEPVDVPSIASELPQVGLDELTQIYRDVLEQQQDPETRTRVRHRLADLEMLAGEVELAEEEGDQAVFDAAITAYETLLQDSPDYPMQDTILYQLSKAYDLNGQSDKSITVLERLSAAAPDSPHLPESYFRRAERYFVEADYARAEATYAQVIDYGQDTPYYTRALYMQGWSRFKLDRYPAAIEAFTLSLDQLLLPEATLDTLPRGEAELVQDGLRVLALMFSNLEGTQTIASSYEALGERSYQHLFYDALGGLYLSQERYRDSAETYQAFTQRYPNSKLAHVFQSRVIEAYESGGFPELILEAKQDYVAAFTVADEYWLGSAETAQAAMAQRLRVYIKELASHYHALAQSAIKDTKTSREAPAFYAQASHYYRLFIASFEQDPAVPRMAFLLAESQFEVGDFSAAIVSYEWMAYEFRDDPQAANAAYTAILAHEKLSVLRAADSQVTALQRDRIESELRFATNFQDDTRAPTVMGHAASQLLELQDYAGAIAAATALVAWEPAAELALQVPAWLVIAHSQFDQQQHVAAENAYQSALAIMTSDDQRYGDTQERLAATIYRQAEAEVSTGDDLMSAQQFERVIAAAPNSAIRLNAQYDAASAYMRAGELQLANQLLLDFRQRYPSHELTTGIATILVSNYETLELWRDAARELDILQATQTDPELQSQALIVAAQYYDKVGDAELAIDRYRRYADEWPEPFVQRMEVMNRLTELYVTQGQAEKQRFWLAKIATAHDKAGAQKTDRSRFLAAQASSVIAGDAFEKFKSIALTLPIKRSLGDKKQAMERALAAYGRCNDYGVEEFTTLSTYRIARIYQVLSSDLIGSQRPAALDALALEQYELMLEEQAFPFEEKAIALHESNARRSWEGIYDQWVQESFTALGELLPARYRKAEQTEKMSTPFWSRNVGEYNEKALALRQQGEFTAARDIYLKALDVEEEHANTHRNIGILYDLYLGEQDKALEHYQRYQDLSPTKDRAVAGWMADLERQKMALAREAR